MKGTAGIGILKIAITLGVVSATVMFSGVGVYAEEKGKRTWTEEMPPPNYFAVKTEGEIVIDGQLNEAEWQNAPEIELACDLFKYTETDCKASCRIMWDSKYLYAAFVCPEKDARYLPANTEGQQIIRADCVELFVDPTMDDGLIYEFHANADSHLHDLMVFRTEEDGNVKLDFMHDFVMDGVKIKVGSNADSVLTLEMAIPFSRKGGLGVFAKDSKDWPTVGQKMRVYPVRVKWNKTEIGNSCTYIVPSPTFENRNHCPQRWVQVTLVE